MIVSSFQAQYGLRLSKEIHDMPWSEFSDLLSGIGPDTALGRMVAIRSETNKNVLKYFTKDQHRIRNEWMRKKAKDVKPETLEKVLDAFKKAFIDMAGR